MRALWLLLGVSLIITAGSAVRVEPVAAAKGAAEVAAGTVENFREVPPHGEARVYCGSGAFSGAEQTPFVVEQMEWRLAFLISPRDPLTQRGFRHEVTLARDAPERWAALCSVAPEETALTSTRTPPR